MKKLFLIITLVSLGNIWQIFGQESELNKLESLKNIELTDTLRIDIKKGGCFHGSWQKLIIVKENKKLQLIKIDDVSGLILKYDKKAVLYNEEDSWLRKNLSKVLDSENTTTLSKKDYILVIDKIIELISTYENCSTDIAGKYSNITISMNDIQEKLDFKCEIQTDL
jgi:hypothetical protein